jgi:hypothetical protein
MVIYKETVITIILTIGLLATVWLIVMQRHPLSDSTSQPAGRDGEPSWDSQPHR